MTRSALIAELSRLGIAANDAAIGESHIEYFELRNEIRALRDHVQDAPVVEDLDADALEAADARLDLDAVRDGEHVSIVVRGHHHLNPDDLAIKFRNAFRELRHAADGSTATLRLL